MAHAPTKVGWDRSAGEWAGSCGGPTPGSLLDALSDQARGRARQRSGCAHRWQQRAVSRAASDHDATRVRSPQPLWLGAPAAYPVRRWQLSWRRRNRASCIGFVRTHHTGTRWSTMCKLSSRACRRWSASLLWTRSSAQSWDRCRSGRWSATISAPLVADRNLSNCSAVAHEYLHGRAIASNDRLFVHGRPPTFV